MTKFDIVITFFTIIYGLMLTDLFLSFHRLIKAKENVKWHWLPVLAAWYLFLIILINWWALASRQDLAEWMNILFFIAYGHLLLLIYLAVSTVLPDVVEKKEVDLKKYYFKNHRYFWGLMTSVVLLSNLIAFFRGIGELIQANMYNMVFASIFIVLLSVLTITKKYWVHSVFLILFVTQTLFEIIVR